MTREKEEHVKGAGDKERRMYEHIEEKAEESGRYGDRAEEVDAWAVMKHHEKEHREKGE